MANHVNLYTVLGIDRATPTADIREELLRRLSALGAQGQPEHSADVQKVLIGRDILGDPELRPPYDARLDDATAPDMTVALLREFATRRAMPDGWAPRDRGSAATGPGEADAPSADGAGHGPEARPPHAGEDHDANRADSPRPGATGAPSAAPGPAGPTEPAPHATAPAAPAAAPTPVPAPAPGDDGNPLRVMASWPPIIKALAGVLAALPALGVIGLLIAIILVAGPSGLSDHLAEFFDPYWGTTDSYWRTTVLVDSLVGMMLVYSLAGMTLLMLVLSRREPLTGWAITAAGGFLTLAGISLTLLAPAAGTTIWMALTTIASAAAAVIAALPATRAWFAGRELPAAPRGPQQQSWNPQQQGWNPQQQGWNPQQPGWNPQQPGWNPQQPGGWGPGPGAQDGPGRASW